MFLLGFQIRLGDRLWPIAHAFAQDTVTVDLTLGPGPCRPLIQWSGSITNALIAINSLGRGGKRCRDKRKRIDDREG